MWLWVDKSGAGSVWVSWFCPALVRENPSGAELELLSVDGLVWVHWLVRSSQSEVEVDYLVAEVYWLIEEEKSGMVCV